MTRAELAFALLQHIELTQPYNSLRGKHIMQSFDGLDMSLGSLPRLSHAKSRSLSAENPTGGKGQGGRATEGIRLLSDGIRQQLDQWYGEGRWPEGSGFDEAREFGVGWKVSPNIMIGPGETVELGRISGSGAIQHIWMMTGSGSPRLKILRMYWDDEEQPSVECPLGDFFASGWGTGGDVSSMPVCVNPKGGLNCYWLMPFRRSARITLENLNDVPIGLFYQIDYTLTDVPDDTAYFHGQFRRVTPVPYKKVYTVLDGVQGQGQFVGVYMCWGTNLAGWWGEGEAKFYLDGDDEFPTICGTGTEDYFCGAAGLSRNDKYVEFNTPYTGLAQVINPHESSNYAGTSSNKMRFGLYRWHIADPIRFEQDFRMTIQALGWDGKMVPLEDDLSSVAFWYQAEPHHPFPALPDKAYLAID